MKVLEVPNKKICAPCGKASENAHANKGDNFCQRQRKRQDTEGERFTNATARLTRRAKRNGAKPDFSTKRRLSFHGKTHSHARENTNTLVNVGYCPFPY